ncbi:MAG: fibronectin type III domain-containing protein, partial [Muribaculaceae bacterium]|nr:fibronectin type III domain-containing protein [Muribaculaceae bacterium]
MKRLVGLIAAAAAWCAAAQNEYTVIVNPAETASTAARINWHTDEDCPADTCFYTLRSDTLWKSVNKAIAFKELTTAYDSLSSKRPDGEDFIERARFIRNTAELQGLEAATEYMYRFSNDSNAEVRYFKTAPEQGAWTAAIISDFHSYAPL